MTYMLSADDRVTLRAELSKVTPDPTGAVVEVEVDNTRHPATWEAPPVEQDGSWSGTARTQVMFRGVTAPDDGTSIPLPVGRHDAKVVLTYPDGQIVSSPMDIVTSRED